MQGLPRWRVGLGTVRRDCRRQEHLKNENNSMKKITAPFTALVLVLSLAAKAEPGEWIYTVTEDDNLWDISERYLDTATRFDALKRINNIQYPTRMRPGTRLRIPMKWVRSNPVPASVDRIAGQATLYTVGGGKGVVATAGSVIHLGDRLATGPDSSVAIRFADDTLVTVLENSVVRFDHLSAHGTTGMVDSRLNLLQGRMDARVIPASGPGSRFEIHTPSAISAVRGTEYRAAADEQGMLSRIEVLHGRVEVGAAKRKVLVAAGFGTRVETDKPPIRPRSLLPAPDAAPPPERIRQLNHTVSWEPLQGATAYRAEISEQQDFSTILWQQVDKYPRLAIPDLADGRYYLRVRGIDELGLEGLNANLPLWLDVRPLAPIPLAPVEGQVLRGSTPELQWADAPGADRYRLEIAADADFGEILVDRNDLQGTRFDTAALSQVGVYHWRLTSIAADGEHGPAGMARSWEIKPVPEQVSPEMEASDEYLFASWPESLPGASYRVQLASDDDFRDVLLDDIRSEPNIRFEQVVGRVRYLRVMAIAPDGYEGPWGVAQRVDPLPDKSVWAIPGLGILGFLLL